MVIFWGRCPAYRRPNGQVTTIASSQPMPQPSPTSPRLPGTVTDEVTSHVKHRTGEDSGLEPYGAHGGPHATGHGSCTCKAETGNIPDARHQRQCPHGVSAIDKTGWIIRTVRVDREGLVLGENGQ